MPDTREQILHSEVKKFISLPGEKLLVAKREHWITILFSLLLSAFVSIASIIATMVFFIILPQYGLFVLASMLLTVNISLSYGLKTYTDWYYHFFIITNRKIVEASYTPFSRSIDDVFLDQVRITEIDVKLNGFMQQLFNVGDVIIYFDRPSHDRTFTLSNIKSPKNVGVFLSDALETIMHNEPIWFKPRTGKSKGRNSYKFADDAGER